MTNRELKFMRCAIDEGKKSKSEGGKITPFVGALAVKDGKILATAYRGELNSGEHAEYTLLEKN